MVRYIVILLLGFGVGFLTYGQQDKLPFQVLVAENAKVLEAELTPLAYLDDVTSIEIGEDGFVALVHEAGSTFELKETTFSFYLKPEKLKNRDKRPPLKILYDEDSSRLDGLKNIVVVHPNFDRSGLLLWNKDEPIEIYWRVSEPHISYKVSVSDHTGKKIQDFVSNTQKFVLKPFNYGLERDSFMFQVSSSMAGETTMSKRYHVDLKSVPAYPLKASDLVIKALDLESIPEEAMKVWKEIFGMGTGKHYLHLFEKFVSRNRSKLTSLEGEIDLMLSENKE